MKKMTLIEMDGFLKGECIPGDLKVNETNSEYLVRKFGELESKLETALRECRSAGITIDNLEARCAALLDERERNQQYIKRRDQENEDIALTVGKLRFELEAADNNLIDSECHVAELEEALRDKQALLEAAENGIAELESLTAPQLPQKAMAVPDEMTPKQASRSYCGEVRGYRDGWNDCRAAMLQSGNFRENKNSSTNYPVIPSEVLSAILNVAKIRADFDDFDGDRRGIGDCLDEAEQELIVTINKYASQLAAEQIATNDVREQTAVPPVPVIQADVEQAIEKLKRKLVECNRYNYCADAVKGVEYACHAAMLQGDEPVTADNKSPDDFICMLAGRAKYLREKGEIKSPELLERAAAALRLGSVNATPIPNGWKLVPIDPTKDMLRAGQSVVGFWLNTVHCYSKMLAAAPAAPQQEVKK